MASISWENWSGAMLGPGMAGGDAVESSFTDIAINSNAGKWLASENALRLGMIKHSMRRT